MFLQQLEYLRELYIYVCTLLHNTMMFNRLKSLNTLFSETPFFFSEQSIFVCLSFVSFLKDAIVHEKFRLFWNIYLVSEKSSLMRINAICQKLYRVSQKVLRIIFWRHFIRYRPHISKSSKFVLIILWTGII